MLHNVKQRGEIAFTGGSWEAGGALHSNPTGATSIPLEITVMIRTPFGMDRT